MALGDFKDLQDQALHDDFDPDKYRTLTKSFINEGQQRLFHRFNFPAGEASANFNIVAGTATLAVPGDFSRLRSLRIVSSPSYALDEVELSDLDYLSADGQTLGQPYAFARDGANWRIFPAANGPYSLSARYWRVSPTLVNDGEFPLLPAEYRYVLVSYARSRLFRLEDDEALAVYYENQYETQVAEMAGDLQDSSRALSRRVAGLYGW